MLKLSRGVGKGESAAQGDGARGEQTETRAELMDGALHAVRAAGDRGVEDVPIAVLGDDRPLSALAPNDAETGQCLQAAADRRPAHPERRDEFDFLGQQVAGQVGPGEQVPGQLGHHLRTEVARRRRFRI